MYTSSIVLYGQIMKELMKALKYKDSQLLFCIMCDFLMKMLQQDLNYPKRIDWIM